MSNRIGLLAFITFILRRVDQFADTFEVLLKFFPRSHEAGLDSLHCPLAPDALRLSAAKATACHIGPNVQTKKNNMIAEINLKTRKKVFTRMVCSPCAYSVLKQKLKLRCCVEAKAGNSDIVLTVNHRTSIR